MELVPTQWHMKTAYSIGNAVSSPQEEGKRSDSRAMETVIFAIAICLLLAGPTHLRYKLPTDGSYMSHDRTMTINGFFMVLIILKHIAEPTGYTPEGVDAVFRSVVIGPMDQFIVATFFFYSGYGIMSSICRKGDAYVHDLIKLRFTKMYFNYAVALLIMVGIGCTYRYTPDAAAVHFLKGVVSPGGCWFIFNTLVLYLFTWVSFRLVTPGRPWLALGLLAVLTLAYCLVLQPYRPLYELTTELCFPAGAAYLLLRPRIDAAMSRMPGPVMAWGAAGILAAVGMQKVTVGIAWHSVHIFGLDSYAEYMQIVVKQALAVLFALGVTWLFAGVSWRKVPRAFTWLGGTAVFSAYVFQFVPFRILCHLGWNEYSQPLYVIAAFLGVLLVAWLGHAILSRLDALIWKN